MERWWTTSGVEKAGKRLLKPFYLGYHQLKADRMARRSPVAGSFTPSDSAPDHVAVLVVDALRPDHVPDLPMAFTTAIAPGTWTFPSVTSLHTGLYPADHGCNVSVDTDEKMRIPAQTSEPTFVEYLRAAGYDALACCGFVMPFFALQGRYDRHRILEHAPAEDVTDVYEEWRAGRERTFAYLHFADLHEPLDPPERFVRARDVDTTIPDLATWDHVSTYDGSAECRRYRDHRLRLYGAAFDYVEEVLAAFVDRYGDSTLLVVTADHGESHWEHYEIAKRFSDTRSARGAGHGGTPFDPTARVPIGVSSPAEDLDPPGPGWASLIDVPRTVLRSVGVEGAVDVAAFDRGLPWQEPIPADRAVRCEASRYGAERKAVYRGSEKLVRSDADDLTLLGTVDVAENTETLDVETATDSDLVEFLPERWKQTGDSRRVGRVTAERLKALGYK